MGDAVFNNWYIELNKAPWTPPGYVFGVVWSLIMLSFSWYLAELFYPKPLKFLNLLYGFQVALNVSWNWVFFNQQQTVLGLVILVILTLVIFYFFLAFTYDKIKNTRYLLLPYLIWLCIATSLNAYIVFNN
jgi:tryptophan-rich sensory protein